MQAWLVYMCSWWTLLQLNTPLTVTCYQITNISRTTPRSVTDNPSYLCSVVHGTYETVPTCACPAAFSLLHPTVNLLRITNTRIKQKLPLHKNTDIAYSSQVVYINTVTKNVYAKLQYENFSLHFSRPSSILLTMCYVNLRLTYLVTYLFTANKTIIIIHSFLTRTTTSA